MRALLSSANAPATLWPEALQTAVWTHNELIREKKCPLERWSTSMNPKLDNLRTFGSVIYAMKLPKGRKFDEKSKRLIFVGFEEHTKG